MSPAIHRNGAGMTPGTGTRQPNNPTGASCAAPRSAAWRRVEHLHMAQDIQAELAGKGP